MNNKNLKKKNVTDKIYEIENYINTEKIWLEIALCILDNENENYFSQLCLILNIMNENNQKLYNNYEDLIENINSV